MQQALRQIGRIWVAIFIAYALLFQSVASGSAAGMTDPAGLLCLDGKLDRSGERPAGHISHGDLCCILCQVPAQAMPAGDAVVVPLPALQPGEVVFARADALPRPPLRPEMALQPRAPPVRI